MSTKYYWLWVVLGLLILIFLGVLIYVDSKKTDGSNNQAGQATQQQTRAYTAQDCVGDECLLVEGLEYPTGSLPADVEEAVLAALDDEYKAYSTYEAVINELGSVRPFSMIIRAEESHIASLKAILDKYGIEVPDNPYEGNIEVAATLQENCQTGVDAEIANAALYSDELLPVVSDYADITAVFNNLMSASENQHLPAFEKCN